MDSIGSLANYAQKLLFAKGVNAGFPDNITQGTHNSGRNATRNQPDSVKGRGMKGGRAPNIDMNSLISKFTNIRNYGYTSPSFDGDIGESLTQFEQNYAGKLNWAIILGLFGVILLANTK